MHRARGASKLKSPPKAVRGSRKAEGGKSAGTMDESVTGSVNLFLEDVLEAAREPPRVVSEPSSADALTDLHCAPQW